MYEVAIFIKILSRLGLYSWIIVYYFLSLNPIGKRPYYASRGGRALKKTNTMEAQILQPKATHLLKLSPGEPLLACIIDYAREHNITAGKVSAIGALAVAKLSFFDRKTKSYQENVFQEVELVSCIGNISIKRDSKEIVVHLHASVSDKQGHMYGGHLNKGSMVSVTLEILIESYANPILRTWEPTIGLYLIDPCSK